MLKNTGWHENSCTQASVDRIVYNSVDPVDK